MDYSLLIQRCRRLLSVSRTRESIFIMVLALRASNFAFKEFMSYVKTPLLETLTKCVKLTIIKECSESIETPFQSFLGFFIVRYSGNG